MALSDLIVSKEWDGLPNGSVGPFFDANFERYARGETNGTLSVRTIIDDRELARLPAVGQMFLSLDFSPDGRYLADLGRLAKGENHLHAWDLTASRITLSVTNEDVRNDVYSLDSRLLAVATF